MNRTMLLDVTLREAPILDYGKSNISNTISLLEKSGVDIIEIAHLEPQNYYKYKLGSTHVNRIEEANSFLTHKNDGTLYCVCLQNFTCEDVAELPQCTDKGIDAIRYVIQEGRFSQEEKCRQEITNLNLIKSKGYKLMIQHKNILSYSDEEIIFMLDKINEIMPYSYSIVDTHGGMFPDDLQRIYKLVSEKLNSKIALGFHGHDNHRLATSNALFFLELARNRETVFVDGSVMGIGAGAGNASTEVLALYLNRFRAKSYDVKCLYDIVDDIIPSLRRMCIWGYSGEKLISGEYNMLFTHATYLKKN